MKTVISHKTVYRPLFLACLLFILSAAPVQAQDTDARLSRIENEIQTLSRAIFRGEKPPPGSLDAGGQAGQNPANNELRLQQIEMELQTLTGRIEEQNYENQQYREQMSEQLSRLEGRVSTLEAQAGASGEGQNGPAPSSPQGAEFGGVAGAAAPSPGSSLIEAQPLFESSGQAPSAGQLGVLHEAPDQGTAAQGAQGQPQAPAGTETYAPSAEDLANDPAGLYDRAFSFLRDRNYDKAEEAFSDFLKRYPDHDLAPNAKYWLGETFYVRNNYERAARIFAEAYQQYPKGPKGPDDLLKLGMSLAGMGKTEDACVTFGQLKKEYPSGAVPVLMRADKEMEKLDCSQF